MTKKIGESFHPSVTLGTTLSGVGRKLQSLLSEASKVPRRQADQRQLILNKAYTMLRELGSSNHTVDSFVETVILKLIKVGMKDDIDELALEGNHESRSLDQMMEELEVTYSNRWKEPEIQLAFMLYGLADDDLPTPTKQGGREKGVGGGTMEGKVSWTESCDDVSASAGLSTGSHIRGTMLMPRGANRKKNNELAARAPGKSYVYLHVTGEIVEEEPYFFLFGGKLENGIRIPTKREFIFNPMEIVPANLVQAKDEFVEGGSEGVCGGAKEAAAVKGLVTTMFSELVESNDIIAQMSELPLEPRQPYLGEVQKRPPLMTSLQAAFDLFDVDASGTLTNEEVSSALRHIGLSHKDASVKQFLRDLDKNGDNEVDMREFLQGLTPDIAHKIANALETNEDMIVTMRAERQKIMEGMVSPVESPRGNRKASQEDVTLGITHLPEEEQAAKRQQNEQEQEQEAVEVIQSNEEEHSAALVIQKRARIRKARQQVHQKRFLATAEGAEMNSAALMIQGKARQRKARQELRKQARIKKKHKLEAASQNEELREFVPRILNETLFNLLREAMETPLNEALIQKLEAKLKGIAEEEYDEDEVLELEEDIDRLNRMPKFDLNLKPKTFVKIIE